MTDSDAVILDGLLIAQRMAAPPADLRAYLLSFYPDAPIPLLEHISMTTRPMVAEINHGIWIAPCDCGATGLPAPGCVVWLDQPIGWCVRCQNAPYGGGWRPVIIPTPVERAAIERVLLCRPYAEDRNWEFSETLEELIAQNLEHGDPIPEAL